MKHVFLILTALTLSTPAFASYESFYCKGMGESKGKTLYLKSAPDAKIAEGEKMDFLLVLRDGSETLFAHHVIAEMEDVMFSFKSRRGQPKLQGMIYLDEYDQTSVSFDGQDMRFNCAGSEE